MTRNKRDQVVHVFISKDKARVMLILLKCGGKSLNFCISFPALNGATTPVGQNLTHNVISLDLGWSRAIEDKAFDPVHRLGPTRPVEVERLVIAGTVEDRLLNIQGLKV